MFCKFSRTILFRCKSQRRSPRRKVFCNFCDRKVVALHVAGKAAPFVTYLSVLFIQLNLCLSSPSSWTCFYPVHPVEPVSIQSISIQSCWACFHPVHPWVDPVCFTRRERSEEGRRGPQSKFLHRGLGLRPRPRPEVWLQRATHSGTLAELPRQLPLDCNVSCLVTVYFLPVELSCCEPGLLLK